MQRLYKFFFALGIAALLISFVFGLLVSMGVAAFIQTASLPGFEIAGKIPFRASLVAAAWNGMIFAAVLFASLIFLFRSAFRLQKKFTLGLITGYSIRFVLLTLACYLLLFAWFYLDKDFFLLYLLMGPVFSLPSPAWWLFPLSWLALFIIYAEKIKNNPEYGS